MSRPPRLRDFDYVGHHRYFLTICTQDRTPRFTDPDTVVLFTSQLLRTSREYGVAIPVHCPMPDHVHVLAVGTTEGTDLRAFVAELKQQTGWRYRRDWKARLWQEGYFDRVLRPEEGTAAVIAYIVNNPVRAGLVRDPLEYPYWGSFTHTRERIVDLITGAALWEPGDP